MTRVPAVEALTRRVVVVDVRGIPKPAGSKRAFLVHKAGAPLRAVVTDASGTPGRDWRITIQHAIAGVHQGPPLEGPLELSCYFTVTRPKAHWRTRTKRLEPWAELPAERITERLGLRESAPAYPATRPDVTKLLRAVEDAATGLLWADDAQIVTQAAAKRYGPRPGVVIHCRQLGAPEGEEP